MKRLQTALVPCKPTASPTRLIAAVLLVLLGLVAVSAQGEAQNARNASPSDRIKFAGFAFQLPQGGRWNTENGFVEGVRYRNFQKKKTSVKLKVEVTSYRLNPPIASEQELLARVGQSGNGDAVPDRDRGAVCARTQTQWQDEISISTKGSGGKPFGTGVFAEIDDHSLFCLHPRAKGTAVTFRFSARMRAGAELEPHGDEARAFFESVRFGR